MENKDLVGVNQENADKIIAKIKEDTQKEVELLLSRAKHEAEKILEGAQREAENKNEEVLKQLEKELKVFKEKALSGLNLEKKKIVMGEKTLFAHAVLDRMKQEAHLFRASSEYIGFLKKSVLESISVVDCRDMEIFFSPVDEYLFTDAFVKDVESACKEYFKRDVRLKFSKDEFSDLGVVVKSSDGGIIHDNRFISRLERIYDEIHMQLLKEAF